MNQSFYFTFGTSESFPFQGGWVEVVASNKAKAVDLFNWVFPPVNSPFVNCAFIYGETEFQQTEVFKTGDNLEAGCHLVISPSMAKDYSRLQTEYHKLVSLSNRRENLVEYTVSGIINEIIASIKSRGLKDWSDVKNRVREIVDIACTYTDDCWAICKDWDGEIDHLDSGLYAGVKDIDSMIGSLAYVIIEHEVFERLYDLGVEKMIERIIQCTECGEYFDPEGDYEDNYGDLPEDGELCELKVCSDCLKKKFKQCVQCDGYAHKDEINSYGICSTCEEELEEDEILTEDEKDEIDNLFDLITEKPE